MLPYKLSLYFSCFDIVSVVVIIFWNFFIVIAFVILIFSWHHSISRFFFFCLLAYITYNRSLYASSLEGVSSNLLCFPFPVICVCVLFNFVETFMKLFKFLNFRFSLKLQNLTWFYGFSQYFSDVFVRQAITLACLYFCFPCKQASKGNSLSYKNITEILRKPVKLSQISQV